MGAAARPAWPLRAALGGFGLGPLRATGGGGAAVRAAGPVRPAALGGLRLGPLCAGPAELVTRSRLRRPGVGPLWRARRRPLPVRPERLRSARRRPRSAGPGPEPPRRRPARDLPRRFRGAPLPPGL